MYFNLHKASGKWCECLKKHLILSLVCFWLGFWSVLCQKYKSAIFSSDFLLVFFFPFKTLHCTLFSGRFIFFKKTNLNNKFVSYILKLHSQCWQSIIYIQVETSCFQRETDLSFWKDLFPTIVGCSFFLLTSDTSSFAGLCSTLVKQEQECVERPHRCDVSAAAARASVVRRQNGSNSLELNGVEVMVSVGMLRQSLSILKQLGSAAKWVLVDCRSYNLQNAILKKLHHVIFLWCLTSN